MTGADLEELRAAFSGWLKGRTARRERLANAGLLCRRSVFGVIEYAPTEAARPYGPPCNLGTAGCMIKHDGSNTSWCQR